jgi:IS30 family transposase
VGHGTASRGEASGMAKLTEADVHEIRRLLRQGLSHPDIASRFNVGRTNIENIKAGRTWAWLPEAA